jgi:hypothetical protein
VLIHIVGADLQWAYDRRAAARAIAEIIAQVEIERAREGVSLSREKEKDDN